MKPLNKLSLALTLATLASANTLASAWMYTEDIDLMTDEDRSMVISDNLSPDAFMALRCQGSDDFNIVAVFEYLGDKNTRVTVRFDQAAPQTFTTIASTNGRARFFRDADKPHLLESMKAHNRLVIRATDWRGVDKTEQYDLTGFTAAVNQMRCIK